MRPQVFVGSSFVAQYPEGGGNFWVPAQYLLGLRALGIDAFWLELLWTRGDRVRDEACIAVFRRSAEEVGVADRVVLVVFRESRRPDTTGRTAYFGMTAEELKARARDALLLNFANAVPAPVRACFGRTALFDIDPGPFQIWAREFDMGVGTHDAYLTIGRNLGAPDSPMPLGNVAWRQVWPAGVAGPGA